MNYQIKITCLYFKMYLIFRRADKNDDGKLSFEEFQSYFSDGVLNQEELKKMFARIDRQQTNNMDTERLCEYFSEYLGEYRNVLTALQTLNITILSAMDKTKMDYEHSPQIQQFVTRFLLRETISQLHSLQNSLESALETIEGQAVSERQDFNKAEPQRAGHRCNRRTQKSVCLSPTDPYSGILTTGLVVESDNQWSAQINRLEQLIDKLEYTCPRLEPLKGEMNIDYTEKNILVAQKQLAVNEHHLDTFKQSLRRYTELTSTQSHCLHISAQRLQSESGYVLYEIWEDQESWNSHLQSNQSKTFQRVIIDCLEGPEQTRTMLLPASWWNLSNE
ncbi:N-terminal EF-hand calcium-binding 3 [Pelobates cultripes]|uniref:N-terminal EF-hand calcium-binding 3 n=2 Tax=Pelobates cultripes TaxID=61616 RepID=A0AAD1S4U1_PELCU|nr:N-terminal EF-hand calcium-binding 3 [Pelobates cultripes]